MSTTLKVVIVACFVVAGARIIPSAAAPQNHGDGLGDQAYEAVSSPKANSNVIPDGPDADIFNTTSTDYNCELGEKVTIYQHDNDDSHIAIRWKQRIHRLDKVDTTTGARRFENPAFGLIWIGIPAKGILLDSKLHRQLANECKNAEQEKDAMALPSGAHRTG